MSGGAPDSGDPRAWLASAASDLDVVRRSLVPDPDRNLAGAAYHLQQAAEKAVKGLLVHEGVRVPRGRGGHDIDEAAALLPAEHPLAGTAAALGPLTTWATAWRYPADDLLLAEPLPGVNEIEEWAVKVRVLHAAVVLAVGNRNGEGSP